MAGISARRLHGAEHPVEWRARSGDWRWRLGGSVGYAVWSEDSSPVFPTNPSLQGQLQSRVGSNPDIFAFYPSKSEAGVIGSLRGDLEYRLSSDLVLGATMRYDRSADWNEARGTVYVRYALPE
jgi:hypothetical protein